MDSNNDAMIDTNNHHELPLFPLQTVLFPTARMSLRIFEPRYVDLVGRCMRDGTSFGVVAISHGVEAGDPAQTYALGTEARIVDFSQGADGLLNVVIEGGDRFDVRATWSQADGLLIGTVVNKEPTATCAIADQYLGLVDLLVEISTKSNLSKPTDAATTNALELAYGLAQILPATIAAKIAWLGIDQPLLLLEELATAVERLRQGNP